MGNRFGLRLGDVGGDTCRGIEGIGVTLWEYGMVEKEEDVWRDWGGL